MRAVVPIAGRGSRLEGVAPDVPKPLVSVGGGHMVEWALRSLDGLPIDEIVFVALAEHERRYDLTSRLREVTACSIEVLLLEEVLQGQLSSVLAARERIDDGEQLIVANCDTYAIGTLPEDLAGLATDVRGVMSVVRAEGEHWSFARTDESGDVVEVAEKVRISDWASTGIYHFVSGQEFLAAADEVVAAGRTFRGEFYVSTVYQRYLENDLRVRVSIAQECWEMGSPEGLAAFEHHLRVEPSLG